MSYEQEYQRSLTAPEEFWAEQAQALPWIEPPTTILSRDENDVWRWFVGAKTLTAKSTCNYFCSGTYGS